MRAGPVTRSWPELGAQGNPAQRAPQASERANHDGGGDAMADRPGRLIPLIPFYAEIQRIRETIETVAEDRIRL